MSHLMAKMAAGRQVNFNPNPYDDMKFDWSPSPEFDGEYTWDHHSAPLENGDRLHVYRTSNGRLGEPNVGKHEWQYELQGHHQTPRFPIQTEPDVMHPQFYLNHVLHATDDPSHPHIEEMQSRHHSIYSPNGGHSAWPTKEEAMSRIEGIYKRLLNGPWKDRAPHQRAPIDYDEYDYNRPAPLDDDFGDIFGSGK